MVIEIVYSLPVIGKAVKKKVDEQSIPTFITPADAEDWFRYNYRENSYLQARFGKNNYAVALQRFKGSELFPMNYNNEKRSKAVRASGMWLL